jgi:hypothetical protein
MDVHWVEWYSAKQMPQVDLKRKGTVLWRRSKWWSNTEGAKNGENVPGGCCKEDEETQRVVGEKTLKLGKVHNS